MTVIVQPITPPPADSAGEVITQYLQKLLGTLTFENFAATQDGDITIYDTVFHYRVGLFLAVPTEAIIAAGQFVKMNQIKERAKWWLGLKVIDPEQPDKCLYDGILRWQPPSVLGQSIANTLQAQQTLLAQQGILGTPHPGFGPYTQQRVYLQGHVQGPPPKQRPKPQPLV